VKDWLMARASSALSSTPLRSWSSRPKARAASSARAVDRGEPGVLPGVKGSVAVLVSDLDDGARGGAHGSVETRTVLDAAAEGGGELIPAYLLVAIGVHVQQERVEQGALPRGDRLSRRGIGAVAEGFAQAPGQPLVVLVLPRAVGVIPAHDHHELVVADDAAAQALRAGRSLDEAQVGLAGPDLTGDGVAVGGGQDDLGGSSPGPSRQVMRATGRYPMGYTRLRRVPEEKRRIHVQPCRVCSLQEDHLERLRRPR
jgi:hypothetical protein